MAASFKQGATAEFNPELIHVKTPEQASKLPAPALVYVDVLSRDCYMALLTPSTLQSLMYTGFPTVDGRREGCPSDV